MAEKVEVASPEVKQKFHSMHRSSQVSNFGIAAVVVFFSSVAGNIKSTKNFESLKHLLNANKIPFQAIDCSLAENEERMKNMQAKSGLKVLPQVFVNGEFKGDFDAMEAANEDGKFRELLNQPAV